MKAFSSRGCLIAVEGSPNSAESKLRLLESYLGTRNIQYVSYQFQEEDPLGQMVYDIENSMFTHFSPETQFLLQCADFYQHAQKIEEELRRGSVILISKYILNAVSAARVRHVSNHLMEAVKDLPMPDHTFICDFSPHLEYDLAPYHYSRPLSFIQSFRNVLLSDPSDDATIIPLSETNEEFLVKFAQLLREFF
jgi:thymidylate kinase